MAQEKWLHPSCIPKTRLPILLMEEILHHMGCLANPYEWDIDPTSTGARRISEASTVSWDDMPYCPT